MTVSIVLLNFSISMVNFVMYRFSFPKFSFSPKCLYPIYFSYHFFPRLLLPVLFLLRRACSSKICFFFTHFFTLRFMTVIAFFNLLAYLFASLRRAHALHSRNVNISKCFLLWICRFQNYTKLHFIISSLR